MVDFNNDNTITTAPSDIVKIMILERRKYVIDAFEHYYKTEGRGINPDLPMIRSRLYGLYLEIHSSMERKQNSKTICEDILNSKTIEELKTIFMDINKWFDNIRITRVDNIKHYDSTNVETENKNKGM